MASALEMAAAGEDIGMSNEWVLLSAIPAPYIKVM